MAEMTSYEPGTFCWIELSTTDADGAKKFYCELFGWETSDNPVGPDMVYSILHKNGKDVGALFQQTEEMKGQGVPVHWAHYVSVKSVDQTASEVAGLGGTVVMEPSDVMDAGRMALIQDPVGATFALWQSNTYIGASLVNEPGSVCWNELAASNAEVAKDFYMGIFG